MYLKFTRKHTFYSNNNPKDIPKYISLAKISYETFLWLKILWF